jgi:hypothetical protein
MGICSSNPVTHAAKAIRQQKIDKVCQETAAKRVEWKIFTQALHRMKIHFFGPDSLWSPHWRSLENPWIFLESLDSPSPRMLLAFITSASWMEDRFSEVGELLPLISFTFEFMDAKGFIQGRQMFWSTPDGRYDAQIYGVSPGHPHSEDRMVLTKASFEATMSATQISEYEDFVCIMNELLPVEPLVDVVRSFLGFPQLKGPPDALDHRFFL